MIKCPKCEKYSATHKATLYVCHKCHEILNPENLLKFLEGLANEVPLLKTEEYESFLESIRNLIIVKKVVEN